MNNLKKFVSGLLVIVILIMADVGTQSASATGFTDVMPSDWYYSYVNRLVDLGITKGVGDNKFAPDKLVTRAEFVTFLCRATDLSQEDVYTFSDTKKHWARKWISAAIAANIIDKSKTFNPDKAITRQEAVEMLCRSLGLAPDATITTRYSDIKTNAGYSNIAYQEYIMLGSIKDNKRYFYPESNITRSEVCLLIVDLIDYEENTESFKAQKKAKIDMQEYEMSANKNIAQVEVTVSTGEEFIKEIGSNKRILLRPGIYNLSSIKQLDSLDKTITWQTVDDGKELNLSNIYNLTIEGLNSEKSEIEITPRYAEIIKFNNCSNIVLKNIKAGHTPDIYTCNAGVLYFDNCSDITISNSELYGCGSVGLETWNTKRLNCVDTLIDHCSLRAINLNNSETINFTRCRIIKHEAYSNIVYINNSKDITFEQCEMSDNNYFEWGFFEVIRDSNLLINKCKITNNLQPSAGTGDASAYFFNTVDYNGDSNSRIIVKDTEISNNRCDNFYDNKESITFENCTIRDNIWKE